MQAQQEAAEIQRQQALAALEEQQGRAREVNAKAEKIIAEIEQLRAGGDGNDTQRRIEMAVAVVREEAAREIEAMSQKLATAAASREADKFKARTAADAAAEAERIRAASAERVAEINAASQKALDKLNGRIDDLAKLVKDMGPAKESA